METYHEYSKVFKFEKLLLLKLVNIILAQIFRDVPNYSTYIQSQNFS